MEDIISTQKNKITVLSKRYINYFDITIYKDEIRIRLISLKTKACFKMIKIFLEKLFASNNATSENLKLKIFTNSKIKKKNLLLFTYSLILYKNTLYNKRGINIDLKIVHLNRFKIVLHYQSMFMKLKSHINKNISFFLSDYLLIRNSAHDLLQSNETFINTIWEISQMKKTPKFLRLPILHINEEYDNHFISKSFTTLSSLSKDIELLCIDVKYCIKDKDLFRTKSYEEMIEIAQYIFSFILHLFSLFFNCSLVINLKLFDVADDFPIVSLIENLSNFTRENIHKKFILNIKSLYYFNENTPDNRMKIDGEKSSYINKTVSKVGDYSMIYLFFFVINKKFPPLKKKFIMLMVSKYLLKLRSIEFSRVNPNVENCNLNFEMTESFDPISGRQNMPSGVCNMLKYVESESESKNILFCRNYNPWG